MASQVAVTAENNEQSSVSTTAPQSLSSPCATSASCFRFVWGSNGSGCLGIGHRDDLYTPTRVPEPLPSPAVKFRVLSCGGCHTLAIDDTGALWAFGENSFNQLGFSGESDKSTTTATILAPLTTAVATPSADLVVSTPQRVPLPPNTRCHAISAGWTHSACILSSSLNSSDDAATSHKRVCTFGDNRYGQCGHGGGGEANSTDAAASLLSIILTPTPLPQSPFFPAHQLSIEEVSCGWKHTLIRAADGRVYAFGDNTHGQLGTGDLKGRWTPTLVTLSQVTSSQDCTASTTADPSSPPAATPLLVSSLSLGWKHSLVISHDRRTIYAMGSNSLGQLGIGVRALDAATLAAAPETTSSTAPSSKRVSRANHTKICTPTAIEFSPPSSSANEPPLTFRSLSTGWSHSLALTDVNQVYGWGRCDFGQLPGVEDMMADGQSGFKPTKKFIDRPVLLKLPQSTSPSTSSSPSPSSLPTILSIACGSEHSMLLTSTDLWIAGWNEHGNLGQEHNHAMEKRQWVRVKMFHLNDSVCKKNTDEAQDTSSATSSSATSISTRSSHDRLTIATGGAACIVNIT